MDRMGDHEIGELRDMLQKSHIKRLSVLYLHGNEATNMKYFEDFLPSLLLATKKQIFIDSFNLDEKSLQMIMYNARHTKEIALVNCRIGDLSNKFSIPEHQKYKLRKLDLFWTAIHDDKHFLDQYSLVYFLRAIKDAKMGNAVKNIHVSEEDFHKDALEKIISHEGLSWKAQVDNRRPKVYY